MILTVFSCKPSGNKLQMENKQGDKTFNLFVGTFTHNTESEGIYIYEFNTKTGELKQKGNTKFSEDPAYLSIHQNGKWLYVANHTSEDSLMGSGRITAFEIDTNTWQLNKLNSVTSYGAAPCYISIDGTGKYCFVANYNGGSVAIYSIQPNGKLSDSGKYIIHKGNGPHPNQESAHAHMILPNIYNELVYASDLGSDKIYIYRIDTLNNSLVSANIDFSLTPGTGPRHMCFHPQNSWAYILGELNGTINFCSVDKESGSLSALQTIYTFDTTKILEPKSADIHIHPNGKFLYASNRGKLNNIAIFSIDKETGELNYISSMPTKGKTPRNFIIDPTGKFLLVANQDSNDVIVFQIDNTSGKLIDTNIKVNIPKPVCLKFYK